MPVPKEVEEALRSGCDNEAELVGYICTYLLTEEHRTVLFKLNLSIEDCLNGRYGGTQETDVEAIYAAWNTTLGFHGFGN